MSTTTLSKRFKPGSFVWTPDEYRIGQISSIEGDLCEVKFFKSVSNEIQALYPISELESAYLSPQTRAYYRDQNNVWSVGRIIDYVLDDTALWYDIEFPNGREQRIHEGDIRVRCLLPVDDPAAVLAAGGMESQFLHDKRRTAVECLTAARSAGFGLSALLSASVELVHHQVNVVRRILNDPIQRYLLADEVGLGKTIEACAVIKQAMVDNPTERVVVVAPLTLVSQWKRELSWRFFLETSERGLRVIPYEDIRSIDPSEVDTFVVDEAQNLISGDPETSAAYKILQDIAHRAGRLLLISATPVLGNEKTLLALLHLLDPVAYRLDDEDAFLRKLERRQDFGRLLLTVKPDQNPVFLRRSLGSLQELVSDDDLVANLVTSIEQSLEAQDHETIAVNVHELYRHIADTYRLHQRLIRTRRRDLANQETRSRLASPPVLEEDQDDRTPQMVDALDQWRRLSLEALETVPVGLARDFEQVMIHRYLRLHESLGTSVEACGEELVSQLSAIASDTIQSFTDDRPALEYALGIVDSPSDFTRVGSAVNVVENALKKILDTTHFPRLVVFGSSTAFVKSVVNQLRLERVAEIFSVTQDSSEDDAIEAVDGFFAYYGPAVICCDRRGEEGLNLQYAHGIVHLDLPVAPTRIEQRIGRLDRFGRELLHDREIHHWVVSPYADYVHPWQAWFELMRDDFQVFGQSISEVQFLLDDLQQAVARALYRRGTEGIRDAGSQVKEAVLQERLRLDEQYALDSRTLISSDETDAFEAMVSVDTYLHYQPLHSWLTDVLQFSDEWLGDFPSARAFRLHWTSHTLVPRQPWQELFPEDDLAAPMTYDRQAASRQRGLRLVRPGLELVDNLETMMQWDDRGTAYATWRMEPNWPGETRGPWLGFSLVFLVEANLEVAREAIRNASDFASFSISFDGIKRRMDAMLPPWTANLYVDIQMEPVTDALLLGVLARPYMDQRGASGRQDFNLGSRRHALYETIGFEELSFACHRVRREAEARLTASQAFQRSVNNKVQNALMELETSRKSLERRRNAILDEDGATASSLEIDVAVNSAVAAGIASPTIRLDSIGLLVVSNRPPRELAEHPGR